jgi:uncharacterized protein (TIGR03437 family)
VKASAWYVDYSLSRYRVSLFWGLIPLATGALSAQALFVKPAKVFGDPNFIGTAANPLLYDSTGPNVVEGRELNAPQGIAVDMSTGAAIVYIADTSNNRVLAYRYSTQLTAGSFADLVLGQPNRFSNITEGPGTNLTTGLSLPTGLAVDGAGNLYVADTGNNRVVRYPKPFSQPAGYQFPNLIIGQKSFSTGTANPGGIGPTTLDLNNGSYIGRTGITIDAAGNLWVADIGNNRVLRFPAAALSAGLNGPTADLVVGQPNMTSSAPAASQVSTTGLTRPLSVAFDPAGNMFVADALGRALQYAPPIATNAAAAEIMGIDPNTPAPFASAINAYSPQSVIAAAGSVILLDAGFNRAMIYPPVNGWPSQQFQFSPSAVEVLGQTSFMGTLANQGLQSPTNVTLSGPVAAAASGNDLYIVDSGNNRVIVYPLAEIASASVPIASRVIGQLDFPYNAPNLLVGAEFDFAGTSANGATGSTILDYSATPPHLYVADTQNNRVLGFKNFAAYQNGQVADLVIGQPNLYSSIVNYGSPGASVPGFQGLSSPTALAVDSAGNLFVADTFNSRVAHFPAPFASGLTAGERADFFIGQSSYNSTVTDPTAINLNAPIGLALTQDGFNAAKPSSGWLVVSDANQNRVMLFPKPFSTGISASAVLGQTSFTSAVPGSNADALNFPRGVAVDAEDHILVADTGNGRVEIFGAASTLATGASATVALTSSLRQPSTVAVGSNGEFWVTDPSQNALFHYPSVDNLPLTNYVSDASLPAVGPRAASMDQYNNLLVADGIDRLLYYVPQVNVVNAANFLAGRALAPGAWAALFAAVSTNPLAPGTQPQTAAPPYPTALGDTQVMINGTASALYYVAQGQINTPLSLNLPPGGTVDLQVVRQSTGQIFGAAEVAMASASPALFTDGGGTGQVAAINAVDGSVNSASSPVVRGQYIELYGTGQGFVAGGPGDGQPSTGQVPTPATPQILIGSSGSGAFVPAVNITYSGLAPTLVDVWQINFQVPATAQAGIAVPITVFLNNIPSTNPNNPTQIVTTLSIK